MTGAPRPWYLPRPGGEVRWWVVGPPALALLLTVSIEEVRGDPAPLDPRFTQGGGGGATGMGPSQVPFSGVEGPRVALSGRIEAPDPGDVDLDLWRVDPAAEGQRTHLGKLTVPAGPFSVQAPAGFGALQIEALQDRTGDGPSADDPFARLDVTIGVEPLADLQIALEEGALAAVLGGAPTGPDGAAPSHAEALPGAPGGDAHPHVEAPPGAPGGDAAAGIAEAPPGAPGGADHPHVEAPPGAPGGDGKAPAGPAPGAGADPFAATPGPRVKVAGTIRYGDPAALFDLDVFRVDPAGPGGRAFAGKLKVRPGAFSLQLPAALEKVAIEVFLDAAGDGPTPGDLFAACPCNPLSLAGGDVHGIEIEVPGAAPVP